MSLDLLHQQMAWPEADAVVRPQGAGPRILVDLAREKIERALQRELDGNAPVRVGLLTKNPDSPGTEPAIAVVCEFGRPVTQPICTAAHRLAWNFARSPLLIVIEPHLVRTWTCCEPPADEKGRLFDSTGEITGEIEEARLDLTATLSASEQAAHALHWVRLATGDFFRQFPDRFRRDGRADRVLLKELTIVRRRLQRQELADDTIHDLLARVVFAQFLFDRKDADGRPALNPSLLANLQADGYLTRPHTELASILADYDEAYRFFRWLNDKFNGDLFPGKGGTPTEREAEWQAEMSKVEPRHLETLAGFVSGRMRGRQRVFWRLYSFDVIPLEFISSIYEEFVKSTGAHYTPAFLVDFILDGVLPWEGGQWDLKILDPACGSGIFLVKAYQRLIQRWKNANPGRKPSAKVLRRLLERNLFGVDIAPHAVRVASFSLYLTMCDEIDPKSYLRNTKFPRLRERQLVHADFFQEDTLGFSTKSDGPCYDLILGNAPWEQDSETEPAREWAGHAEHHWEIPHKNIETLFLAKAATLTNRNGRVSMIQSASSLLFNRTGTACRFRDRLFTQYKVEEIVNLSALRFELFGLGKRVKKSTSPPCIVTMRPVAPDDSPVLYMALKQIKPATNTEVTDSSYSLIVEPQDISHVWPDEAISEPFVWTTLAWGGRRDLALIRKLSSLPTMEELETDEKQLVSRRGVSRGEKKRIRQPQILDMPILDDDEPIDNAFMFLDARRLPLNKDPWTHESDSSRMCAFQLPQLIAKQSWQKQSRRFKAVLVDSDEDTGPVFCTRSYFSVHVDSSDEVILDRIWLSMNSSLAVYYLLLTSGRLASWIPEPNKADFMRLPLPPPAEDLLADLDCEDDIDERAFRAFGLKPSERALVDDLFKYTMPDFQGDASSPGRKPTQRKPTLKSVAGREPHLAAYCRSFIRVLKAGFGQDKAVCATVFQDPPGAQLPVRLAAIHFDWPRDDEIAIEPIGSGDLCERLLELDEKFLQTGDGPKGGIFFQRIARVYVEERRGRRVVPTVYIVKPDRIRYWTRSAALRDADEVAADMQLWKESSSAEGTGRRSK